LQRMFTFDFRFYLYWLNWQIKPSKLAVKDFETAEFHQDTWNHYLMLRFVLALMPRNAKSNLDVWWSYNPLRRELMLPSARMLNDICRRKYKVTMDAIKK
jgi:hypothetical protein